MNNSLREILQRLKAWIHWKEKENNPEDKDFIEDIKVLQSVAERVLDAGSGVSVEQIEGIIDDCTDEQTAGFGVDCGCRITDRAKSAKILHDLFTAQKTKDDMRIEELEIEVAGHQYALEAVCSSLGLPQGSIYSDITALIAKEYTPNTDTAKWHKAGWDDATARNAKFIEELPRIIEISELYVGARENYRKQTCSEDKIKLWLDDDIKDITNAITAYLKDGE